MLTSREHHRKILHALQFIDKEFLIKNHIYFAGGTLISLLNNEFRVSTDIYFITSSDEGYKAIRSLLNKDGNLDNLFKKQLLIDNNIRKDQYAIRTKIIVDDTQIKFEILKDKTINIDNYTLNFNGIPCCTEETLIKLKILANSDRAGIISQQGKDIIDLSILSYNQKKLNNQIKEELSNIISPEEILKSFLKSYRDISKNGNNYFNNLGISIENQRKIKEGLNILKQYFYPHNRRNKCFLDEKKKLKY